MSVCLKGMKKSKHQWQGTDRDRIGDRNGNGGQEWGWEWDGNGEGNGDGNGEGILYYFLSTPTTKSMSKLELSSHITIFVDPSCPVYIDRVSG